ncbi:MAG: pentapeptide repeat-containing protein [Cyanobacteria bacterium P01_D01_bin.56]
MFGSTITTYGAITMDRFKATKRGLARPTNTHWLGFTARSSRIRLKKMAMGTARIASTFTLVAVALYAALTVETAIKDESWKTPKELGGSIANHIFPWETRHDLLNSLENSVILGSLDGVSIITALILFVLVGRREEERQAHYMAWFMLDAAHDRETSYARYHALQDLNDEGLPLKGLDTPGADLIQIRLEGADLQQATLNEAKLQKSNLRGANLTFASLKGANLHSALLERVVLFNASLEKTCFSGSDLSDADLGSANLRGADLFDTNLRGANLNGADLAGASFRKARNLTITQVKQAKNWDKAEYDEDFDRLLFPLYRDNLDKRGLIQS